MNGPEDDPNLEEQPTEEEWKAYQNEVEHEDREEGPEQE